MTEQATVSRYFVSYSGVKLPLKLVNEIDLASLHNRNTYYQGYFDAQGRMLCCQKIVYGEVESEHVYAYYDNGILKHAQIKDGDEVRDVCFDENGKMTG